MTTVSRSDRARSLRAIEHAQTSESNPVEENA